MKCFIVKEMNANGDNLILLVAVNGQLIINTKKEALAYCKKRRAEEREREEFFKLAHEPYDRPIFRVLDYEMNTTLFNELEKQYIRKREFLRRGEAIVRNNTYLKQLMIHSLAILKKRKKAKKTGE